MYPRLPATVYMPVLHVAFHESHDGWFQCAVTFTSSKTGVTEYNVRVFDGGCA